MAKIMNREGAKDAKDIVWEYLDSILPKNYVRIMSTPMGKGNIFYKHWMIGTRREAKTHG